MIRRDSARWRTSQSSFFGIVAWLSTFALTLVGGCTNDDTPASPSSGGSTGTTATASGTSAGATASTDATGTAGASSGTTSSATTTGTAGSTASSAGATTSGGATTSTGATTGAGATTTGTSAGASSGANSATSSGFIDASGLPATSPYVVVDQFGYLPASEKIAVIRDPQTGFDAAESFAPGTTYAVVDVTTGNKIMMGAPVAWNGGATDPSSGDKAWWFDFSSVTMPGNYYVLDIDKNVRSFAFRVADEVYRDVLMQAVRMFFYQRAGQNKDAAHAGAGWVDKASHVGPLQDHNCRLFSDKSNAATEKDLWGGWYDAGDYNKYTAWTANYVENLLRTYVQNPAVFTDDFNIPESGNGIADIVDEAKWGMDFLVRMQNADGSLLSIVGEASGSPPSAATGQSLYGSANTTATLAGATAFAYGSRVFRGLGNAALTTYADDLLARAKRAWSWASANPAVLFRNNDSANGSQGLGAGQQETDDMGRAMLKLDAACQLFADTADTSYRDFFDANYTKARLFAQANYVSPWDVAAQDALLDYTLATGATATVVKAIRDAYLAGARGSSNLGATLSATKDPYLAYLQDYVWGSNSTKGSMGCALYDVVSYGVDASGATTADLTRAAARYVHYLHGANPLSLVYLSNMAAFGAENSVNEFYHSWFADGSPAWDRVGTSTYGPPPGYLPGGPNPSYNWDACCPSGCNGAANNAVCTSLSISPPKGQPAQKSYKDFNTAWPLDSWSVTEPDNGYQLAYIRLLSKFVK